MGVMDDTRELLANTCAEYLDTHFLEQFFCDLLHEKAQFPTAPFQLFQSNEIYTNVSWAQIDYFCRSERQGAILWGARANESIFDNYYYYMKLINLYKKNITCIHIIVYKQKIATFSLFPTLFTIIYKKWWTKTTYKSNTVSTTTTTATIFTIFSNNLFKLLE